MSDRLKSDAQALRALQLLKRRWWVIVLLAVVSAGAAYALAQRKPKQYSATAALLFQNSQLDQALFGTQVIAQNADPTRQAATNQALVELPTVSKLVAKDLGISTGHVERAISFGSDANSDVLSVTATDHSPGLATKIANAYVHEYITFRARTDQAQLTQAEQTVKAQLAQVPASQKNSTLAQSLQSRSYQLSLLASLQTGDAEVVQTASRPHSPSSPNPPADAAIGLGLGLILAAIIIIALERYDRRIKTVEEVEELYGAPIIGTVPESQTLGTPGAMITPREQDVFRMVRAQLRYFDVDRNIRRVLVTSADSGEGKSTLSLNLARAAASSEDKRALLIEADMRRPSISNMIGMEPLAGLSELLSHSQDLASGLRELVVTPVREEDGKPAGYDVLVAGSTPPNPLELLESARMTQLLDVADSIYDLVIIDTPPIGVVSDPIGLVHQVDGVVIVSRIGQTRRDHAQRLIKQLSGLSAHVLGVVVNAVQRAPGYYGYYDYERPTASGRGPLRRERRQRQLTGRR